MLRRILPCLSLAALSLPALAQSVSPYTLELFRSSPQGVKFQRFYRDIDSIIPSKLTKYEGSKGSADAPTGKGKDVRLSGACSRDWSGMGGLVQEMDDLSSLYALAFIKNQDASGTALALNYLEGPAITLWELEADNGLSATETLRFTYIAKTVSLK